MDVRDEFKRCYKLAMETSIVRNASPGLDGFEIVDVIALAMADVLGEREEEFPLLSSCIGSGTRASRYQFFRLVVDDVSLLDHCAFRVECRKRKNSAERKKKEHL